MTELALALADRYRLERELGAGGMATVYLAHDLKHDRAVALKVLRPELAAVIGAQRFLSEIRTTAHLQHPHILPLFDSGQLEGTIFYVMPVVDGESLRERLLREKQLPIDDALRIVSEVASALDYAHRHGVIHRDIKPENILLHDGRALVADFGIARAAEQAGAQRLTETGMSLGTPQYMSPEQAMGERDISARSDIFSLGVVLYELLIGEPPFTGATAQAIVARVLTDAPRSLSAERKTVPAHIDAAVRRALQKLPADRFQSAADFAMALSVANAATTRESSGAPPILTPRSRGRLATMVPWLLVTALIAALIAQWSRSRAPSGFDEPLAFGVELGLGVVPGRVPTVQLSRDGKMLVYVAIVRGRAVVFRQDIGALKPTIVAGTDRAIRPFLSHDGKWVAFVQQGKLSKVLLAGGGTPIVLANANWGGGDWREDGRIVYTPSYNQGLWEINPDGSAAELLTAPDTAAGEVGHWWPQYLPDGEHVLFTAYHANSTEATIEVISRGTKKRTVLLKGSAFARYIPSARRLLFAKNETVLSVTFDPSRFIVGRDAQPVLHQVAMAHGDGFAAFAIADNGTLAYLPSSSFEIEKDLVVVNRAGAIRMAIPDSGRFDHPRFSPDGQRLSVDVRAPGAAADVWVFPLGSDRGTRITSDPGYDWGASWTSDSRELVFTSEHGVYGLSRVPADASAPPRTFLWGGNDRQAPSVSANGDLVAFVMSTSTGTIIRTANLKGEAVERDYVPNALNGSKPALSPDGRWMAYESDESGRVEVYVQSFPDPAGGRWKLSSAGGSEPIWTRAGRELIYRQRDSVLAIAFNPATREPGTPTLVFSGPYLDHTSSAESNSYDVSRDGERFLMLRQPPERTRRHIVVTLNWVGALGRESAK